MGKACPVYERSASGNGNGVSARKRVWIMKGVKHNVGVWHIEDVEHRVSHMEETQVQQGNEA